MVSTDTFAPPSNTLKAADLDGNEVALTIAGYEAKEFEEKDQKTGRTYKRMKPILSFEETDKTFVCNKTNLNAIAYAYGKEMDEWVGKPITLYPTMVEFGGNMVEAIRVRVVKQGTSKKPAFMRDKDDPRTAYDERNPPPHGAALDDEVPFAPEWRA